MKTVFNNDQIPHLWAHKAQSHAQGAGSISFRDETGYSYAMPICRHAVTKTGEACILFTTHSRSVTTAKHINQFRQAIPFGVRVYPVDNVLAESKEQHAKNIESADHDIATTAKQVHKTRPGTLKAARLAQELSVSLVNRNDYAAAFGVRVKPLDMEQASQLAAKLAKDAEKARRKAAKAAKAREVQERIGQAAELEQWRTGEIDRLSRYSWDTTAFLRANGDEMETSQGARVPLTHAKRAILRVVQVRASGTPWQRNGSTLPVGHYHIDSISPTGDVVAGCHRIAWEEIERFAKAQGWLA